MGWLKKESAYERRIRELEEEAERIRKNMQAVMKNVPRDAATGMPFAPGPLRTAGAPARPSSATPPPADPVPAPVAAPAPPPLISPSAPKLASYLASGSFGKSGSPSRERRLQRNKALIMLAVMLMLLYIFFTWAM